MTATKPKHRRARGSGSVYKIGNIWWFSYKHPDGTRKSESSGSTKKTVAEGLLAKRTGARDLNLAVIPKVEQLSFDEAADAVLTDFEINKKPSLPVLRRRIDKHLRPYFGGRRMAAITAGDIAKYIKHRMQEGIVDWQGKRKGERIKDVSNSEINRELTILTRIFSLAIERDRLGRKPAIPKLAEPPAQQGFFEREQIESVLKHLSAELAAVVEFAYITGWRVASEVVGLEWRQVDFKNDCVRLDAGSTKNGDARVFYLTAPLRRLLMERHAEQQRLQQAGTLQQLVFFRMRAERRGGEKKPVPIGSFKRAWLLACRAAGVPGRRLHDLRRTAVRDLDRAGVSRTVAMKLVGHRTESMYARYNITSDGDLRGAARTLDAAQPAGAASLPAVS